MSSWAERIGLEHPVVQAGMGGGLSTAPLAAAVSAAGGLGTVGIMPPRAFSAELRAARALAAGRPVAANLLLPFLRRAHVRACVESGVTVVVLHGGFAPRVVATLRAAGIVVLQQVGTATEARRALADGVDGLIVQGLEAGGHTYAALPLRAALRAVRDEVPDRTPVLAAGGIVDGADVARVLAEGADAAVVGTRFLATEESRAHPGYKRALIDGSRTVDTLLFGFGWPMRHRVLVNAATDRWCRRDPRGPRAVRLLSAASGPLGRVLPLTVMELAARVQHPTIPVLTPGPPVAGGGPDRILRATALYAGQGVGRIGDVRPAAEVVRALASG
ncbi:2-nitropropane dioxygenase NPD [Patulibacter medicamentivorans]|uniref:2-nitropropane dioxygenase NPD n=1 Tax=Patulibacter medicamentivorans TaxID=1097667 RepID=H0E3X8_9ACTN|nr:nitronate monooxygenase [Patulibacter medicamentivorans]EHN11626.1 2-nitropropane dioxygenase NPD [Patulibacter medicamentivorans]